MTAMSDEAAAPFRGGLHVSHSQASTYLICSERYRLKYVKGIAPAHRAGDQVFGSAVHMAIGFVHEHMRLYGQAPKPEKAQERFSVELEQAASGQVPVLWDDDDTRDSLESKGRELVRLFVETCLPERVLHAEKAFKVDPEVLPAAFAFKYPLVGVLDLVEQDASGATFITELKTAARKFDDVRLRYDLQVSLYAAVREALGYPAARMRFRVLLKTKLPRIETHEVRRDLTQIAEAGRVVTQVYRAIEHGVFFPQRSWACTGCPYRPACGE